MRKDTDTLKMGGRNVSNQCPGADGDISTSSAVALMKAPAGVLSRQLLRTLRSSGLDELASGDTISCVHTHDDSKMAPPKAARGESKREAHRGCD